MDEHKLDDEALIQQIALNDLDAFKELFSRYRIAVFNTCYRLIGDIQQAEDAAQDVFLKIYRSAGSFRGKSKASTWIYRISINLSLNLVRRNRRSRWMQSLSTGLKNPAARERTPPSPQRDEPDKRFEKKEMQGLLKKSFDSLPDGQRAAFILSKSENLTASEIAGILEISVNAVEARIHRAKKSLQKKITACIVKKPEEP